MWDNQFYGLITEIEEQWTKKNLSKNNAMLLKKSIAGITNQSEQQNNKKL